MLLLGVAGCGDHVATVPETERPVRAGVQPRTEATRVHVHTEPKTENDSPDAEETDDADAGDDADDAAADDDAEPAEEAEEE